ncbi:MAG: GH25 family lysozyme [Cyclobacteriaceae bacterium]
MMKSPLSTGYAFILAICCGIFLVLAIVFLGRGASDYEPKARVLAAVPVRTFVSQPAAFRIAIDTLYGINAAHINTSAAITQLNDSVSFVVCKATRGSDHADPAFHNTYTSLAKENVLRGAFHFYVAGEDPAAQASLFTHTVVKSGKPDLPLFVDIERENPAEGTDLDREKFQQGLLVFLQKVEQDYKLKPVIYVSRPFAERYLNDPAFAAYEHWLAPSADQTGPDMYIRKTRERI